jgi:transposase
MFKVELYGRVRRAVLVDGMSQRTAAREFGISRKSVRKMVAFSVPPGYRREQPAKRPKLGAWVGVIDAILDDDKQRPVKQRHTAKRVWERLREEHQFTGGYTIVKDYLRSSKLGSREMFVPLVHPAGEAQADFGEALVVIGGVECKAHYLAMDLPHSDDCFVVAFPAETTERTLRGHKETIAERFERDRAAFLPLPEVAYDACDKVSARVSSLALVRYKSNDYSVPTRHGHLQVLVRGYVHEVTIACGGEVIARHPRSYQREVTVYDPLHYLALLEHKTRALDQAAPLQAWQLPACFATLRRLLEARLKHGGREYVQVLRLLETFSLVELTQAVEDALELGTLGFDAVKHLLLCRIDQRPPRLDMENYPHLPLAQVRATQAADSMSLLATPSNTGATV